MAIDSKSEIGRKIFGIIRKCATSITTITEAILALDVSAVISAPFVSHDVNMAINCF